jgi:hypothetical protein
MQLMPSFVSTTVPVTILSAVMVPMPSTIPVIVTSSVAHNKTAKTCDKQDNGYY